MYPSVCATSQETSGGSASPAGAGAAAIASAAGSGRSADVGASDGIGKGVDRSGSAAPAAAVSLFPRPGCANGKPPQGSEWRCCSNATARSTAVGGGQYTYQTHVRICVDELKRTLHLQALARCSA